MESKLNHIRNLIYIGQVDHEFHEKEKEFVRRVASRLGISAQDVENELESSIKESPPLPKEEIMRFILLDDLINMMASDENIKEEEIQTCERIAGDLGFDPVFIRAIAEKLKKHLDAGHEDNQTQVLIKNELFTMTAKNYHYEKYS